MSKEANPPRLAENEAKAVARMLRVSPQKLNLLAQLIRGKKVDRALADLEFSRKRIAHEVKKTLESAIANAENNHGLDVDDLVVAQAYRRQGAGDEALPRPRPRPREPRREAFRQSDDHRARSRSASKRLKDKDHGSEG